ncbi:acyltransferase family protein [Sinomonas halotolerans]|uniref:Acyltransferase family protein n=1 Tax=Sinomonas halotolerans TaxID=1644133 RepID=A0ABU9X2W3_9MICC
MTIALSPARPDVHASGRARRTAEPAHGIRGDIQGLRALAVALVVVYHLWPHRLTGGFVGVDVFFVISGFLITSHIVENPPATWRDLVAFWGKRVRRLLPASLLVLAVTAVATRLLAPSSRWEDIAAQTISAALYVQNWALSVSSVDYLAAENAPSPVQHFWSLSVEEQFYLLWPVLFLVVFALSARWGMRRLRASGIALGVVFAASLAYSVYATAQTPPSAYFVTPTRVWELALGGLVAVAVAARGRRSLRGGHAASARAGDTAVVWAGLACILAAAVLYTGRTPFPGYTALLPVLGAAAVIWGDAPRHGFSPAPLMGLRPVRFLGDISYSVYLWHWPLIALVPFVSGGSLGPLDKAAILVATLCLAWLTKTFVEDRLRRAPRRRPVLLTFGPAAIATALVVGLAWGQIAEVRASSEASAQAAADLADGACFGAAALADGADGCSKEPSGPVVPVPEAAVADRSDAYEDGCWAQEPDFAERPVCTYGDGPTRVALVGNSHAGQWLPALQKLAEERGWTITTYLASACNATDATLTFATATATQGCRAWGQWALEQTKGTAYDLVVTSERVARPVAGVPAGAANLAAARKAYAGYLAKWAESGTRVLVLKDTPNAQATAGPVPDCVALNEDDLAACSGTAAQWRQPDPLFEAAKAAPSAGPRGISTADLDRYFCSDGRCHSVIGKVVVYFDGHHMTATYSRTLAPYLGSAVERALEG